DRLRGRSLVSTLFPVYEETPPRHVKVLLSADDAAPLARHREPGDGQEHDVERGEDGDDPARDRPLRALPPERESRREQEDQRPEVGDDEADADPRGVAAGEERVI